MPRCIDCKQTKPAEEFPRNRSRRGGLHCYCKQCHNRRGRESKRRLGGSRRYHLKRRYGLSLEDFDDLLERQGGVCAVCKEAPPTEVDHDHDTGEVRGLLCSPCNGAVGLFGDDPDVIRRAIAYLILHGAPDA